MKEIVLTQGKVALVDDEDYLELSKFKWYTVKTAGLFYAVRHSHMISGMRHTIFMHREILAFPKGMETDHINGNGLDNRRENLRIVTTRENQQNRHTHKSSKYPGVDWKAKSNKWRSRIQIDNKSQHLGYFNDEKSAAQAYTRVANWITRDGIIEPGPEQAIGEKI